jgi:hypothetical protein
MKPALEEALRGLAFKMVTGSSIADDTSQWADDRADAPQIGSHMD